MNTHHSSKPNILVVLGPTASGKSDLAVALALKLNGEVVSADSRQVYRGLDLGSGKITEEEMRGVPHHLLDVADPKERFTVNEYQQLAYFAIEDILSRGKLPIICGGTGFYIQSIVDGISIPEVDPQPSLRDELFTKSNDELFSELANIDPTKAATIDKQNKIRLVRAIEIATVLGKNEEMIKNPRYNPLQIGITFSNELLKKRIEDRLEKRLKSGMIEEVERLHQKGLSFERLDELGLEYRYIALYLQKKISLQKMKEEISTRSWQFAKRQMTWFKRDKTIWWMHVN